MTTATKACPFCRSNNAKEIRASLFGPGWPFHLLVTALPFLFFAAIAYGIYHGGLPLKKSGKPVKNKRHE